MFIEFSEQLYRLLAARDYMLADTAAKHSTPAATPYWIITKTENATHCVLHVVDVNRCNLERMREVSAFRASEVSKAGLRSIMLIYVLVSEKPEAGEENAAAISALMNEAEPYMGQEVYTVFWHAVLETGTLTAAKGQPGDLFGLRAVLTSALKNTGQPAAAEGGIREAGICDEGARTFDDIAREAAEASPFQPRCKNAVWTWVFIVANAVVLLLMYLDGYAYDAMVPARFGAIVPERVINGEYFRLFTAMFVHFGAAHFFMNAVGLAIFGQRVERYYGRGLFLCVYIMSGLCGSAASLLFTRGYAAGASGAVYGLVGAVFILARISKKTVDQLSDYLMLVYISVGMAMGLLTPGIDNFGHIGGLLAGTVLGAAVMMYRKRMNKPTALAI